jgi:glycosyltransferase involved in cell wall biosynthesis
VAEHDRPLRIALVTDAIGPFHHGGKEQRYLELAPRLADTAEVHVYTMNWWRGGPVRRDGQVVYHAICPFMPLYRHGRRSIRQAVLFALACLRLLFASFDVLEADHMPYLQLVVLKLVTLIRRRGFVITWHEFWGVEYWRSYLGLAGRIGAAVEGIAVRLPHAIIAASPETAERVREEAPTRVRVISAPNGIDLNQIDAIEPLAGSEDVVTVARLLDHKRVDLLLDAVAILRRDGLPLSVGVIGSGSERHALGLQTTRLDLDDLVTFYDNVRDHSELLSRVKGARVAAFPSQREGFGIAVLEALACGTPVVTTRAPDNFAQHLIERSGGGGIICDPSSEGLAQAIRKQLQSDRGGAQRAWLEAHDWNAVAADVLATLVAVRARHSRG